MTAGADTGVSPGKRTTPPRVPAPSWFWTGGLAGAVCGALSIQVLAVYQSAVSDGVRSAVGVLIDTDGWLYALFAAVIGGAVGFGVGPILSWAVALGRPSTAPWRAALAGFVGTPVMMCFVMWLLLSQGEATLAEMLDPFARSLYLTGALEAAPLGWWLARRWVQVLSQVQPID